MGHNLPHNIIQWNTCGFQVRRPDIDLLLNKYSPAALCIQETKLKEDKDFKYHQSYYTHSGYDGGGVGIIVSDKYVHRPIPLQTPLQAVAVNITIQNDKYTLCSIYIPPTNHVSKDELEDLKAQLPAPYILLGDFNAHSSLWGATTENDRGDKMEEFILDNDLILFNNKTHTYFSNTYGTTSLVDLTICSPSIYLDFDCHVFDNRHGSDHYPIQLTYNSTDITETDRLPQWNFKKADWPRFRNECREQINEESFNTAS